MRKENDIMKMTLKKMLGLAALGITLLSHTVPTWAGYVGTHDTVVRTSPYPAYAWGSMVGARYSADPNQTIGCSLIIYAPDPSPTVFCDARSNEPNGTTPYLSCLSTDPVYVEIVQGMTDSSDIYFELDPATGRCANLTIYDGSSMLR
jgi:hypothetical protein